VARQRQIGCRRSEGIDTIVIAYRNQSDDVVNEVLKFKDDVVIEGHGTYPVARHGI
jgi:hypothetical protein